MFHVIMLPLSEWLMVAAGPTKMWINFCHIPWCHIPEDSILLMQTKQESSSTSKTKNTQPSNGFITTWRWNIKLSCCAVLIYRNYPLYFSKTINPALSNGACKYHIQCKTPNFWLQLLHFSSLQCSFPYRTFGKAFLAKEICIAQLDFWPMQVFSKVFSMVEKLEHMYT